MKVKRLVEIEVELTDAQAEKGGYSDMWFHKLAIFMNNALSQVPRLEVNIAKNVHLKFMDLDMAGLAHIRQWDGDNELHVRTGMANNNVLITDTANETLTEEQLNRAFGVPEGYNEAYAGLFLGMAEAKKMDDEFIRMAIEQGSH